MNNEKITYQKYPSLQYESYTWDTPTQAQKDSIKNLVEILRAEYNLGDDDIYAHAKIAYKDENSTEGVYLLEHLETKL